MKYTVVWLPHAENELARLYNAARDKQAVTDAANQLERELSRSPGVVGESRGIKLRVTFEKPLGILYEVSEADRKVQLIHVWRF
jgi:hypothetical protein